MLTIVVRSILDHWLCNQHLTWIDMYFKVDLAIKLMSDCQRIYYGTFPMCHISWEMQKNKKNHNAKCFVLLKNPIFMRTSCC